MKRWSAVSLLVMFLSAVPHAEAQFAGGALYEVGSATTDIGLDKGSGKTMYGMGFGASYELCPSALCLLLGADVLVRGFGIGIEGLPEQGVGVFDQSDLWLDQFVAARIKRVAAGLYLEQRRIDRGAPHGKIGFPAFGLGFLVRGTLDQRGRIQAQFTYASYQSGELEVKGVESRAALDAGRSFRISGRYGLTGRVALRIEYADTQLELESVEPTFEFFDHQQRSVSLGILFLF